MKKNITFIILFLVSPIILTAQVVYDLRSCIETGLLQNYDIRISRNNQEISDNNLTLGNAGYLPSVDLTTGYSGTSNNTTQNLTNGEQNKKNGVNNQLLNAGVNLNWTIFDGFNIQTSYKRLKELKQMGELSTRLEIENFVANLSAEYYNYIQQNTRLENLKYAVKLSKERLRIAEARYQIGDASRPEMQQARVDFNSDSSQLIKQYEILHISRIALNQMMAIDEVDQLIETSENSITFNESLNKDNIWEQTLASNSYLLLVEKEKSLSALDLKSAQSENYPYLRLNAGYGITKNIYNTGTIDNQRTMGFNYGVTLGFNIFSGGNRKRKQKNAKIEIENKQLLYEQAVLSLKSDFSKIWMAYKNNIELTNLERENVKTARENHEATVEQYKQDVIAGIELREAQISLLDAEERLVRAEYDTKLCEISLMQISGQILSYFE